MEFLNNSQITSCVNTEIVFSVMNMTEITEPEITEHEITEHEMTGTEMIGTEMTGTKITGTEITGHEITGHEITEHEITEHEITEHEITETEITGNVMTGTEITGTDILKTVDSPMDKITHEQHIFDSLKKLIRQTVYRSIFDVRTLTPSSVQVVGVNEANFAFPNSCLFGAYPDKGLVMNNLIHKHSVKHFFALMDTHPYTVPKGITRKVVPLPDKKPIPSSLMYIFIDTVVDICKHIINGDIIYVHCWGGHGRSGLAICLAYFFLYGMNAEEAMGYAQYLHHMRVDVPPDNDFPTYDKVRVPQTDTQRDQFRMLISPTEHIDSPEYEKFRTYIYDKREEIILLLN